MSINVLIITLTHYFALINRTKLMHEIDRTTGYIKELEKKSTLNVIKKNWLNYPFKSLAGRNRELNKKAPQLPLHR